MSEELKLFAAAVREMRRNQTTYFRTKSGTALANAIQTEKHVDSWIELIFKEPDLFNQPEKVAGYKSEGSGV